MSKIALNPNESGTGVFTLAAPDSNADRTLTLPDEEGTVATIENIPPGYEDQDALDLFNVSGAAPVFACRAWVNFDGTTTTPNIFDSGNVSSISRLGGGQYVVNFATNMPDANYSSVYGGCFDNSNGGIQGFQKTHTHQVGSVGFTTYNETTQRRDHDLLSLAIFR